jgi:hypothetical protein
MRKLILLTVVVFVAALTVNATATTYTYTTNISGANESSPNLSPGTGSATVIYDNSVHTLDLQMAFIDLMGNTTASHIHGPTTIPGIGNAGVITTTPYFVGFPIGVTSGAYNNIFDLTSSSSYNPSFITANGGTVGSAEAVLAASLANGTAYLNIHTTQYPGGEIRGFLLPEQPSSVPEPSTFILLGAGIGSLALLRRKSIKS